jgi:hypothetical protein
MRHLHDERFFAALRELRLGNCIPEVIMGRSRVSVRPDESSGLVVPKDAIRLFATCREANSFNASQMLALQTPPHRYAPEFFLTEPEEEQSEQEKWSKPIIVITAASSVDTGCNPPGDDDTHVVGTVAKALGIPRANVSILSQQSLRDNNSLTKMKWYDKLRFLPHTMRLTASVPLAFRQEDRGQTGGQAAAMRNHSKTFRARHVLQVRRDAGVSAGDMQTKVVSLLRDAEGVVFAGPVGRVGLQAIRFNGTKYSMKRIDRKSHKKCAVALANGIAGRPVALQHDAYVSVTHADAALQPKVLKAGCRVMLVRNMSPTLVNGSMGTILRFVSLSRKGLLLPKNIRSKMRLDALAMAGGRFGTVPYVKFDNGEECVIPWIHVPCLLPSSDFGERKTSSEDGPSPAQPLETPTTTAISAVTMPLMPAYAFTVHKVQGLTLPGNVIMACNKLWPCSHLVYVAASRVRRLENLFFVGLKQEHVVVDERAKEFSDTIKSAASVLGSLKTQRRMKTLTAAWVSKGD